MIQSVIKRLSTKSKSVIVFIYDLLIVTGTFFLAYELRLNQIYNKPELLDLILNKSMYVVPTQLLCFYLFGLYRGIWRFSSIPDLVRIIKGVSLAVPTAFLVLFLFQKIEGLPRSIFFIQWALLLIGIGGGRFAYRVYRDLLLSNTNSSENRTRRTLILGAGYAAQILIRDIKNDILSDIHIVGLLDDDFTKRGKMLHGFKVLGSIADVAQVAKAFQVTDVIITIPSATKEQLNKIISYCEDTNLKVKTIPRLADLLSGKLQITKLRKVTPADLLGRDQVDLNMHSISHMISGRDVLITGAGGSIGSELCRQVLKLNPKRLICFDVSEYNMYELSLALSKSGSEVEMEFILGDVTNEKEVEELFEQNKPQIVFHAAAYKHVPLMEVNPSQAIKVNVRGTQIVANMANKFKLDRFVLVSTDKAVNPTNVMGTTKRIAEMICQDIHKTSKTKFVIVRFGNVLGSSGSVIPRFQKQIEKGGPVTVTHPEIQRYFMSIPEASQLVIQAGALGNGGEIFVLDMGESVKIIDLAKQMITLAGLKVDEDIKIEFTGLRPGEKLYEELLADDETTLATDHERVRVAKVRSVENDFNQKIQSILNFNYDEETSCIREALKNIVPEYDIPENLVKKNLINFPNQSIVNK